MKSIRVRPHADSEINALADYMMDGLRMKAISNFENHFIFYIERPSYIDILRVLHSARDIPEAIKEGLDPPL